MSDLTSNDVAYALDALAAELVYHTAEALTVELRGAAPSLAEHAPVLRRQELAATAQRFHDLVQLGASLDWDLAAAEYEWMWRALGWRGMTFDRHMLLLDAYFTIARGLRRWDLDERRALDAVADHVRALALMTYAATAAVMPPSAANLCTPLATA